METPNRVHNGWKLSLQPLWLSSFSLYICGEARQGPEKKEKATSIWTDDSELPYYEK